MSKTWNAEKIYINEIIRVTYKCNWNCLFCNVLKTNNYWEKDISNKEIIYNILSLTRKYSLDQRKKLILSFSWWEPTLNKNLLKYIKFAKKIWVWIVEIQTNWVKLFNDKEYILKLIDAWLDEIFLAQHWFDSDVNKKMWSNYNIDKFIEWTEFVFKNNIHKKISIYLNIVINKINIFSIYNYILFLLNIWFIKLIPERLMDNWYITKKISFWFIQPNWYAEINKNKVLLKYIDNEINEINKIVDLCKNNNILPDFHFVCPPLCIINYPEYNLEYARLKKLEKNKLDWNINKSNLESYKFLWKEKQKFEECVNCKYNNYCLWFYKNWIDFVWEEYVRNKVDIFLCNQISYDK